MHRSRAWHAMRAVAPAWILSLGVDLFLHAGLLARVYAQPSPFLLEPDDAFRRIPIGYISFLALTLGLYWILCRLGVREAARGFRYGLAVGGVAWGALVLGLYSISTAEPTLLAGWWVGQALELGLAGAVLGAVASGTPLKRVWLIVASVVLASIVATVVLQSLGLAPAMKVV